MVGEVSGRGGGREGRDWKVSKKKGLTFYPILLSSKLKTFSKMNGSKVLKLRGVQSAVRQLATSKQTNEKSFFSGFFDKKVKVKFYRIPYH